MIWPDEEHDSSRQLQKKLEYAKELELQIELRRARQREEQLELEELERKFQPDDRSPAKWLIDGGYSAPVVQHLDFASYRSPFRSPQQQPDAATDGQQYNGRGETAPSPMPPSAGEPSGAPSVGRDGSTANGHTRFRITDLQDQADRLRERAQQLEWKRILDEQVRENARLKQQEEEERRRDEAGSVREEIMFLRDQQLAAQRRVGFPVDAAPQQSPTYTPAPLAVASSPPQAQYEHLDTSGDHHHHHQVADYQQQHHYEHLRKNDILNGFSESQRGNHLNYRHHYEADTSTMPPPAPLRFNFPSNSPQPNRESVTLQSQQQQQQSYDSFADSRSLIINEYRSLLADIRREREELRQEKEELRQEKEQLRLERTLLQLENEKMANFVETQRRLNEQQLEMQRQQEGSFHQQPPQQQQQQSGSAYPSPLREYYQAPLSSVRRPQRPPAFDLSQINQMERSIAALGMDSRSVKETRVPERRPSPISMDDFAVPQNRLMANVIDSPRFKRLSQFRFKPTAADEELNTLDQSLIGESVFVALSPEEVSSAASRGPPRITETASPRRGEKAENSFRNELRSSRVIKSRGFYNIESEAGAFPARTAEKEAERRKSERQPAERRKKSSSHKSPSRMPRSTEKARLQQEKPAAKAFKEYETSSKFVPFTPSSSAVDSQQQQQQKQQRQQNKQQQRQFASSAASACHNDGAAAGSEDNEEPELSRSLFQVKVLVPKAAAEADTRARQEQMASFQFPIATGKKKPVKVFECPTETWKERAPRVAKKSDKDAEPELPLKQQIRQEFDETFESVKDFANASLKGKEKKAFEAKKIEALGGKAAKARTMPYNILMGLKKKGAIREKKQQEMSKDADVVSGKRKASSKSNSSNKKKKIDYGLQVTKGKFKNGILTIELMEPHKFGLIESTTATLPKEFADSFPRERDVRQRVPTRCEELENHEDERQHDPLTLLELGVERDEQRQCDQEQVECGDRPAVASKHVLQLSHRSDEEHRGAEKAERAQRVQNRKRHEVSRAYPVSVIQ